MNEPIVVAATQSELPARLGSLDRKTPVVAVVDLAAHIVDDAALSELLEGLGGRVLVDDEPARVWIGTAGDIGAVLSGRSPDVVVDKAHEIVLMLDGTNTDTVVLGTTVVGTAPRSTPALVAGVSAAVGDLRARLVDGHTTDLARVIGYDGAVADGPLTPVGPELLAVPFWTPAMCRAVIAACEAADAWGSDADDPVPGEEISTSMISPLLFGSIESHLRELVLPLVRVHWPLVEDAGLHDAFVIKYAANGGQPALRLHHDVAQISGSVRLNGGYEGGQLEFPRQNYSNRDVPIGTLLLWPSLVTHPHQVAPVTRGVKYGLTVWFRLPVR